MCHDPCEQAPYTHIRKQLSKYFSLLYSRILHPYNTMETTETHRAVIVSTSVPLIYLAVLVLLKKP